MRNCRYDWIVIIFRYINFTFSKLTTSVLTRVKAIVFPTYILLYYWLWTMSLSATTLMIKFLPVLLIANQTGDLINKIYHIDNFYGIFYWFLITSMPIIKKQSRKKLSLYMLKLVLKKHYLNLTIQETKHLFSKWYTDI